MPLKEIRQLILEELNRGNRVTERGLASRYADMVKESHPKWPDYNQTERAFHTG